MTQQDYKLDLLGPPGPAPRPGLAWKEETHRWIRPEALVSEEDEAESSDPRADSLNIPTQRWQDAAQALGMTPPEVMQLVTRAYSITNPKYRTVINILHADPAARSEGVIIRVAIVDTNTDGDEYAGELSRLLRYDKNGDLTAHHSSFFIEDAYQNQGIAADMLERTEDAYIAHGVKHVTLLANDEVGGYAWARQGFDFIGDSARENVDIDADYTIHYQARIWGHSPEQIDDLIEEYHTLEHAWDIAAWNPTHEPPGEHLGKRILMGSNWHGVKSLDPDSPGYKIGRMYREARKEYAR